MNKTILLVGASSGIGRATAIKLINSGNQIINISRRDPEIEGIQHYSCDILQDVLPEITVPIHGLAYFPGSINLKPFKSFKTDDFRKDLEINYLGAIQVIQKYLPLLTKNDTPSSIVLFSTVAVQTGMNFHSSIAGAKGAIEGLTRALSAELAPKVRVNCIAPSLTDTPLAAALLNNDVKKTASAERHPLKIYGDSNDIASMASYLLSEDSKFMTGQIIKIDGGMSSIR